MRKVLILLLLALPSTRLIAQQSSKPIVIYDSGETISAFKYRVIARPEDYKPIDAETKKRYLTQVLAEQARVIPTLPQMLMKAFFPHKTPGLTLGKVEPRQMNRQDIIRPFFLIGTDQTSRRWLRMNLQKFKEANALGFIVEAETTDAVNATREEAQGLQMFMISGSEFVRLLGIKHYPVFVSATVIQQ